MTKDKLIKQLRRNLSIIIQETHDAQGKKLSILLDKKKEIETEIYSVSKMTYLDINELYGE